MKQFIIKGFFFIVALIVVFLIFEYGSSRIVANRIYAQKESEDIKYYVVGHSHAEMAYNDTLIKGLKNISYSGESYLNSYYKSKYLLNENPQIDTIFVEFSNNQIDEQMDEWVWGDDFLLTEYPELSSTVSVDDKLWLLGKNPSGFLASSSLAGRTRLKRIFLSYYKYKPIGGFRYLDRNKTDSLIKAISKNAPDTIFAGSTENFSTHNLRFLKKFITFCEKNGTKMYLIRSPLHPFYRAHVNEKPYFKVLRTELKGIEFLDFSRFPASDSEFADLSHLNYKGTKKFSVWLDSLLQSGFLNKQNKQKIITREFERINSEK